MEKHSPALCRITDLKNLLHFHENTIKIYVFRNTLLKIDVLSSEKLYLQLAFFNIESEPE
jgi:hypothetical protein